eukprot:CAMPEP_0115093016 /NCGR_PEP_ID=MMETSP0227-20121206/27197_1 /TAXON_ID=89957 /ORGANISM="Polarella glacialis, Strain CCMP 1383" /LENGTH=98 /DNA_ID=CAMNT_0002485119 /DNA_START=48 /DNA_END=340 /DNA_ORIENTATION=+
MTTTTMNNNDNNNVNRCHPAGSEESELLASGSEDLVFVHLDDVEADGLGQRPALTGSDNVSLRDLKGRGAVNWEVAVALLEAMELLDVVQVVAADDDG